MKKSTNKPPPKRTALASTKADLRELKGNSRATVAELQSFLAELKGKSPQEMLGVVAASHLIRSLILSTSLVFAAIVAFTAVPYFFGDKPAPKNVERGSATRSAPPTSEPTPTTPEPTPAPEPNPVPEPDPLSKLGVGEELEAPPNKNPLENTGDDFLKDLE